MSSVFKNDIERQLLCFSASPELSREARALILAAGGVHRGDKTFREAMGLLSNPDFEGINLPSDNGAIAGRELARLSGDVESCYHTCAYRLGTIPNQCAGTVMDAILASVEGTPFLCHQTGKLCEGWVASRKKTP